MQSINGNFFLQVKEKFSRRGDLLDFLLTNSEKRVGNTLVKGSLCGSNHEIMEFRILKAGRRVKSKLTTLDFWRADFGLCKDLLGRIPWTKSLEGRGAHKTWLIFKDHLLQAQRSIIHPNNDKVRQKCPKAYMDEK